MTVPSLIVYTMILFQTRMNMSSESMVNQPASEALEPSVPQTAPLVSPEQPRWNPKPAGQMPDPEEWNRYHHFHQKWVAKTYGVKAVCLPPQHFFQDPTYPLYLRNLGTTILGMYINLKYIIKFLIFPFPKK